MARRPDPGPVPLGREAYNGGMGELPLQTTADIWPRARYRFTYCAAGLIMGFVLTGLLRGWDVVLRVWWAALIAVLLPALGAYQDWRRLKRQSGPD